jgi:NADH:ubiquinone oxidoreductase subunit C
LRLEGVPGLVETKEAYGETTLVVDPSRLVEACRYLRDERGFNFLSDITPTDYLGWASTPPAGYYGTASGRDLNTPGSAALAQMPA